MKYIQKTTIVILISFYMFSLIRPFLVKAFHNDIQSGDYIREFEQLEKEGESELKRLINEREYKLQKKQSQISLITVSKKKESRIATINPNSPLIQYEELFFKYAPSTESAYLAMAVAGQETNFGSYFDSYNAWGVMCWSPQRHTCDWNSWEYSIKRIFDNDVTGFYYNNFDGTYESLYNLFSGRYCTEHCNDHVNKVWYFYNLLNK